MSLEHTIDEIIQKIDKLSPEEQQELAKMFQYKQQAGSVFDKLKGCDNSHTAAKVLLLHKTKENMDQDCAVCGLRYICSQFLEGRYNNWRCVAGISKELDKQFEWGEVYYEPTDKVVVKEITLG